MIIKKKNYQKRLEATAARRKAEEEAKRAAEAEAAQIASEPKSEDEDIEQAVFDIDNIDDVIENDLQTIIFDYEITYFINDNEDEIVDNIKNAGKYVVKVKIDESVTNYFMNDYQQEII